MQIPVNKNYDNYKDDFFKGLTLQQTVMGALTIAVGVAGHLFFTGYLGISQSVSLYLIFPLALPFAGIGFLQIDGRSLPEYLAKRYRVIRMPCYRYKPFLLDEEAENLYSEAKTQKGQRFKKNKKGKPILLGHTEEEGRPEI